MNTVNETKNKENKDIIELSFHKLSYILASLLLTMFFVFIGGYYWGKKASAQVISDNLENEMLADKMESALCFNSDLDNSSNKDKESDDNLDLESSLVNSNFQDIDQDINKKEELTKVNNNHDSRASFEEYAAHLAGFGTESAAKKAVDNFAKFGYEVKVSERVGKSSDGKERKWYQVVTDWYDSKTVLENLLVGIKKAGKLKNVTIVSRASSKKI